MNEEWTIVTKKTGFKNFKKPLNNLISYEQNLIEISTY